MINSIDDVEMSTIVRETEDFCYGSNAISMNNNGCDEIRCNYISYVHVNA